MCVEAKAVSDMTSRHVSVSVLGEAMVWQARLVLGFPNGPTSTITVLYVDSVPPQRERACFDLLWIYESVQ